MKILILSCSTGEGHNSAAYAIREEFIRQNIEVFVHDALSFGNQKAEKIVKSFFNNVAVKTPSLFGMMYKVGSGVSDYVSIKSPVYLANLLYANNMGKYINKGNFDAVICTHLFPMEALTYLKRNNRLKTKVYGVLTDYTAIPFIEETELDGYFIPHKKLEKEFIKKGMDKSKLHSLGIPVSSKYIDKYDKKSSREKLKLPQKKRIVLIMTGGIGCGDVTSMISALLDKLSNALIIVLAGRNKNLKTTIENTFNEKVMAIGFTDKVSKYMAAADVLLSKPGGLSSTEAVVKGVPLIHTMPIPGCETKNANFFEENGISLEAIDNKELVEKTLLLLNDENLKNEMLNKQKEFINHYASHDIVSFVVNDVNHKVSVKSFGAKSKES